MSPDLHQLSLAVAELLKQIAANDRAELVRAALLQVERDRIEERNRAIRAARPLLAATATRPQAEELARELSRYQAGPRWAANDHLDVLPGATGKLAALHRISFLGDGKALGWRQIFNIFRDGELVQSDPYSDCTAA